MNSLDMAILAILVLGTVVGVFRGLVREATSLFTVAIAVAIGAWLYPQGLAVVRSFAVKHEISPMVGFAVAFVALYVVLAILAFLLRRLLVHRLHLGWLDAIGGAVFGAAKALTVSMAIVVVLMGVGMHRMVRESTLFPYMIDGVRGLARLMPQELENQLNQKLDEIQRRGTPRRMI
jgi:membrane protein required for colicin V production